MPDKEEHEYFGKAIHRVGREVGASILPPSVGARYQTKEAQDFYQHVAALLHTIAYGHGIDPDQVRGIKGIKSIRPQVSDYVPKKYQPHWFFGVIVAETIVGGAPPRAFYWPETTVKNGMKKIEKHLSDVWPLQPAVYAEDVDQAVAAEGGVDASYIIANLLFSYATPERLEEDFGIIVLEANNIEPGVGVYVAIPQGRPSNVIDLGLRDPGRPDEVLWRLGVLGDYLIDPDLASRMNDDFEARMKELEAKYL